MTEKTAYNNTQNKKIMTERLEISEHRATFQRFDRNELAQRFLFYLPLLTAA